MALLPQPELLVLDELTTGVDPFSRMELGRLVTDAAAAGTAVVAATAYLDEAERAEHVLLLHRGRRLASGSPQSIIDSVPGSVEETSEPDSAYAWRRGDRWRRWRPAAERPAGARITLEDAVIVQELLAEGAVER
jgi:ABC-2 type transport system ATP-binding protein